MKNYTSPTEIKNNIRFAITFVAKKLDIVDIELKSSNELVDEIKENGNFFYLRLIEYLTTYTEYNSFIQNHEGDQELTTIEFREYSDLMNRRNLTRKALLNPDMQ